MKKLDPIGITLLTTKVRKLLADCVQFRADGGASATDPILGPIGETYLADLCDVVDGLRADDSGREHLRSENARLLKELMPLRKAALALWECMPFCAERNGRHTCEGCGNLVRLEAVLSVAPGPAPADIPPPPPRGKVDCLSAEIAELRGEVREWACEKCNFVYPGPPAQGFTWVQCPRCGGGTMPKTLLEKRGLSAENAKLAAELVAVRQQMADKEAAGYAVVELWEKRTDHLRDENIKLRKAIGKARRLAFAMRMKAMVCDEVLCNTGVDVDEGN